MKDLFTEIVGSLQKKDPVVLATIVSSDGSSPLPSGSMMLVKSGGEQIVGTVGGGLLEALVIEEAKQYFRGNKPARVGTFDLNDDVSNEGMICGGSVDVLLEPLSGEDFVEFAKVRDLRDSGSDSVLLRFLRDPERVGRFVLSPGQQTLPDAMTSFGTELQDAIRHTFGKEDVRRMKSAGAELFIQPIRGLQNLVIFGGGHVSKYLAQIASASGFSTTVIDDREEFADPDRFPGAVRVFAAEYGTVFSHIEVKPSTYIVIVTRGHKSDQEVLEKAIHTQAKYIGMIGSKRKVIACFESIAQRGVSLADLRRVHAPIGLDIGAVSAEEIAVSIVAELISVRRGFSGSSASISEQLDGWFEKKK